MKPSFTQYNRVASIDSVRHFLSSCLLFGSAVLSFPLAAEEPPKSLSSGVTITKFADSESIVHPTGLAIDQQGRLFAIESHTHFPPEDYTGPKSDNILILKDTNGDGMADSRTIFYNDDLTATMDIAIHPETGAIYVAARNEIVRLWDKDGDGIADPNSVERQFVYLETECTYPHDGISGLSFDPNGDLYFGVGENLGAPYTLTGSDGTSISDHGEGGNIFHISQKGENLKRIATGFWNPFGVVCTPEGHVFATDNDPSSRPPCRLHHIIEGGDHGYQFRYGRSGLHPFVSWDGELTGTLPMLHSCGEAPCDVMELEGNLLVASWADHRVEWYPLDPDGRHFKTEQKILIQGGNEFRPVAFARANDGVIYVSDWVKRDYAIHGHGAIWAIHGWDPDTRPLPNLKSEPKKAATVEELTTTTDPYELTLLLNQLEGQEADLPVDPLSPQLLVAHRRIHPNDAKGVIPVALKHSDPGIRLLALKWISDLQLKKYRKEIDAVASNPKTPTDYHAAVTALVRLNGSDVDDKSITAHIRKQILDPDTSDAVRNAAFLILPDREDALSISNLRELFKKATNEQTRVGILLSLRSHPDQIDAQKLAGQILRSDNLTARVRNYADLASGASLPTPPTAEEIAARPKTNETPHWMEYLETGDESISDEHHDDGRIAFQRTCATCHRAEGFGRKGGPDLSTIGSRGLPFILQSILDPGAEVAPQYEPLQINLVGGETYLGFLLREKGGTHTYADITGAEKTINNRDIVSRSHLPMSLMPLGLTHTLNDSDLRALLGYLESLK